VIVWGATPYITEQTPTGQIVFTLEFASPDCSYRAVPIAPGQITAAQLNAAMNAMYPRTLGVSAADAHLVRARSARRPRRRIAHRHY
jgi:hypothetical protein